MVKGQVAQITIGKLAREAGLRPSAIRYYEARGLLRPSVRMPNGYRMYDAGAGKTLRFLRRAQDFGLTLREIKRLVEIARQGRKPCAHVRELIEEHLTQISAQIEEMKALRKELRSLLQRADTGQPQDSVCPIIER